MKILRISSSIKGDNSASDKLAKAITERLFESNPNSSETVVELSKTHFPHLDPEVLGAFFTPEDQRNDSQHLSAARSERAIRQLFDADVIIIGVAFYNFGIPDKLKTWIDHVVRSGETFKVENGKATGQLSGKKVYLAIASGWAYSEGPMQAMDFTEPYLRTILGFIGLDDIKVFRTENTGIPELKELSEAKSLEAVAEYNF